MVNQTRDCGPTNHQAGFGHLAPILLQIGIFPLILTVSAARKPRRNGDMARTGCVGLTARVRFSSLWKSNLIESSEGWKNLQ